MGAGNVISDAADLRTYECDALTSFRARPSLVVLPASTDEVVAVMKVAREAGMPVVPRGAGTGLSGGALPTPGSLVLALSRMTKILDVDFDNGLMRVQPGVINLDVSRHLGPAGYYYAPDPSSQSVCTIGGNVAENSGGAHCLKYGFTVNHVPLARAWSPPTGTSSISARAACSIRPVTTFSACWSAARGRWPWSPRWCCASCAAPRRRARSWRRFHRLTRPAVASAEIIGGGIVPAAIEM